MFAIMAVLAGIAGVATGARRLAGTRNTSRGPLRWKRQAGALGVGARSLDLFCEALAESNPGIAHYPNADEGRTKRGIFH
jgi:hypothetical protein